MFFILQLYLSHSQATVPVAEKSPLLVLVPASSHSLQPFLYRVSGNSSKAFAAGTQYDLEALRRSTSFQNSLYPNHCVHHLRSHR